MTKYKQDDIGLDQILYLIVLPREGSGQFSPFQGFRLNTFAVADCIQYVCGLPATIDELFCSRSEAITWRALGFAGYAIILLDLEFLDSFRRRLPVTCVISTPENSGEVERFVAERGQRGWLHLTTDEENSKVRKLWDFSRKDMFIWSQAMAKQVIAERGAEGLGQKKVPLRRFVEWGRTTSRLKGRSHNITLPTETALHSLGFVLSELKQDRLLGNADEVFVRALADAADELKRVRRGPMQKIRRIPGTPTLIITVPSVYRHLSPQLLRRDTPVPVRKVIRQLLRQRQYIAMRTPGEEGAEMIQNSTASAALYLRAQEMRAYTAALSVTAASLCAPVLRCPPQIDRVRELLIRLAGMKGGATENERRNKLVRNIGTAFCNMLPEDFVRRIEQQQHEGIKLIGDTPLELLPLNDLPLGLRAITSRMPSLPGNLLLRHSLFRAPAFLDANDFKRLLIVRAFDADDPLREMLVEGIHVVNPQDANAVEIQIVDVSTKEEFVAAFNGFEGALAIFDGHGKQKRDDAQGTIRLGNISFNPFELYGKIRVPLVMFLSACETHPLEGIEASVASAFLFMGARSVLGTMLPIDGLKAGILMARFLLRFREFLPLLSHMIPWSQVVSGMLRMSYTTDVLRAMQQLFSFSDDVYKAVHVEANTAINQFRADWFERLLASLSEAVSVPEAQLRETWLRSCYFTDTVHYVHLGQPEHLFVRPVPERSTDAPPPGGYVLTRKPVT